MKSPSLGITLAAALAFAHPGLAEDVATAFHSRVQPLLKTYCTECHGGAKPKARVNLSGARTLDQLIADRDLWFRVLDQIEAGTMPPEDEKQPTKAGRAQWPRGCAGNSPACCWRSSASRATAGFAA